MINYHKDLVKALNTVLPTHYEMILKSGMKTPCISYLEVNNYVIAEGEYRGYSRVVYQVKVWANDIALIQKYAGEVCEVLRPLGFKRTASGELYDNNSSMIQKIMTFEALGFEEYDLEV